VVAATLTFGVGAIVLALQVGHAPKAGVALALAPALFIMGVGSGAIITPNQALTLMEVDPVAGSTAGGVLQTAQRIGLAVGQGVIGAVFFISLGASGTTATRYGDALRTATFVTLGFVAVAAAVGFADLLRTRHRVRTDRQRTPLTRP
jgi:MFS family permease